MADTNGPSASNAAPGTTALRTGPNARLGWPRRVWMFLSVANVWASGVASAQHDWSALAFAVFFAAACWWLSGTRVTVREAE